MATYIIRAGENGPVKIGKADDPEERLAALQTGHPDELVIIRIVDTPYDCEEVFHEHFANLRLRGEWFRFTSEMMAFIPPPPNDADAPIATIVQRAKRRAVHEASDLLWEVWRHFRGIETRERFYKRVARLLQIKERRVRALMRTEHKRVDVHEIEGLRALAKKLKRENRDAPLLVARSENEG